MENKTIRISVGGIIIAAILVSMALLKVATNINNIDFYQRPFPTEIAVSNLDSKTYLNEYEVSSYLGISWEAFMTVVKSGEYKGGYITETDYDGELLYIFPRAGIDEWFASVSAECKHMTVDLSLLPLKE